MSILVKTNRPRAHVPSATHVNFENYEGQNKTTDSQNKTSKLPEDSAPVQTEEPVPEDRGEGDGGDQENDDDGRFRG